MNERVHHSPLRGDLAARICAEIGTTENVILLEIYSDDVKHAGGNRNSNDTTIGHSYFGVVNMAGPDSRRQGYWQSHHFCLPKDYENTDELKQYGLVVQDLKDLIENDLVLPSGERFKVRMFTLSGDQKELHIRMGLVCHFMAEYTDRFTYASMQTRINAKSSTELRAAYSSKRTAARASRDIDKCEQEKRPVKGHIRRPLLETVPHYNPFEPGGTSACVSHDLHTGINKYDLSLSFRSIVIHGWTTIAELNGLITSFKDKLTGEDADTYPGNIAMSLSGNSISIQGNMAQTKNLVRFMPLILKPIVDRHPELLEHPAWKVILHLAELNSGWASFAISESQLQYLEQEYNDFIDDRFKLAADLHTQLNMPLNDQRKRQVFTDLKPKHGTLLSYPALTRELGSIAYFSTLPAEQKNGRIKKIIQKGNNFKNVIKSAGKIANLRETFTPRYVEVVDSVLLLRGAALSAVKDKAKNIIQNRSGRTDYKLCAKARLLGVQYERLQAVAYYDSNKCDTIHIGTIETLVLFNEASGINMAILVNRQNKTHMPQYKCYRVTSSGTTDFIYLKDLATHAPCNKINMGGELGEVVSFSATPTLLSTPSGGSKAPIQSAPSTH